MLGRDQHPLDLDGPLAAVLVDLVAHRHLGLAVRAKVREDVGLAHGGEPLGELVREHDRERHQLVRLAARVAEHHPLVAGADAVDRVGFAVLRLEGLLDALRDVGGLLVDRDHHTARLGIEAVLRARVADVADRVAHDRPHIDVRLGGDLARDDHEARRDQRLAGDAGVHVVRDDGVEDGVGDLVGDLVRVAFGDRLGGELERARAHRPSNPAGIGGSGNRYSTVGSRSISCATRSMRGTPVEHRADPFGDGHLHPEPVRELAKHRRRGQSLHDHPDRAGRLLRRGSLRDELAAAPVPARARPAGDDEVADPGEAREGLRAGAGHLGQPPHLGEPAGDERRLRVVAEPEPVGPSRRERDHVLRRRAELDAEDVVVHVDTEGRRRDRELELHGEREALARDHRGGGQPLRDLLRDVRAGEDRDRAVARPGSRDGRLIPGRAPS